MSSSLGGRFFTTRDNDCLGLPSPPSAICMATPVTRPTTSTSEGHHYAKASHVTTVALVTESKKSVLGIHPKTPVVAGAGFEPRRSGFKDVNMALWFLTPRAPVRNTLLDLQLARDFWLGLESMMLWGLCAAKVAKQVMNCSLSNFTETLPI